MFKNPFDDMMSGFASRLARDLSNVFALHAVNALAPITSLADDAAKLSQEAINKSLPGFAYQCVGDVYSQTARAFEATLRTQAKSVARQTDSVLEGMTGRFDASQMNYESQGKAVNNAVASILGAIKSLTVRVPEITVGPIELLVPVAIRQHWEAHRVDAFAPIKNLVDDITMQNQETINNILPGFAYREIAEAYSQTARAREAMLGDQAKSLARQTTSVLEDIARTFAASQMNYESQRKAVNVLAENVLGAVESSVIRMAEIAMPPTDLLPPVPIHSQQEVHGERGAHDFVMTLLQEYEDAKKEGKRPIIICKTSQGHIFLVQRIQYGGGRVTAYGLDSDMRPREHTRDFNKIDLSIEILPDTDEGHSDGYIN